MGSRVTRVFAPESPQIAARRYADDEILVQPSRPRAISSGAPAVMHVASLGDSAIVVTVGDGIDETTHNRVRALHELLEREPIPGQIECVPAFTSVAVHYDPSIVALSFPDGAPYDIVSTAIEHLSSRLQPSTAKAQRIVEIPVCYGGDLGPDLDDVARAHGMTTDQVAREHAAGDYVVYMVGFLPGFPYLGGLPERLATPRRAAPRTVVPAGSVGIGGAQTGIYSMDSPGGWNIIGRTPLTIFDADRQPATLLRAGDGVRFRAIDVGEFARLNEAAA